jgi:glycosyltransferase involved in cell wall biosynthesis
MTDAPPTFTVVVPSFNQGRFIDDALRSLLDQHYPSLEILVMDGASSDDTVERLKRYGNSIFWISEKDDGQSDAIAKGFARAKHEWITWLNSDDVQCNCALWVVSDLISKNNDVDVVFGRGHYMDAEGGNHRPYPTISAGGVADVRRELFEKGYVAQPSVFFRKSAYERVGGIDRTLKFCMDYDLWVRLALAGCRFVSCPADLSGNRWYETTKTAGQLMELLAEVAAIQVKHFVRVSPYFVQAVSDNLYQKLHSTHFGDDHHMIYRLLYFKAVWVWFNLRRPLYCLYGFFFETIAKSGPIVGDKLNFYDYWTGIKKVVINKLFAR